MTQPTLSTTRLILRPLRADDAGAVHTLASDRSIASTTRLIPHPYTRDLADTWVASLAPAFEQGLQAAFGVCTRSGELVGAASLTIARDDENAELGYWIGKPFWNRGYATEASAALLDYAFHALLLHRVHACQLTRNPASGRVLAKIGMQHEGRRRHHIRKWGTFEDVELWGVLRSDRPTGCDGE